MPKLLDLFCGGGGAAMGYHRAGFDEVVGVDIAAQPRYPFRFVQADALEYLAEHGQEFDVIHASPPCQGYSIMNNLPWLKGRDYPLLILPTMEMLEALGKPYVLENVMGARYRAKGLSKRGLEAHGLKAGWLCGQMFGLPFYRHRLFATNWFWLMPGHPKHTMNLHPRAERFVYGGTVTGLPGGAAGLDVKPRRSGTESQQVALVLDDGRGLETWPGRRANNLHGTLTSWQENGAAIGRHSTYRPNLVKSPTPSDLRDLGNGRTRLKDKRISNYVVDGDVREKGFERWRQNGDNPQAALMAKTKGWRLAAEAMGIDWCNRAELTQAIPPAYTEFIGRRLLAQVQQEAAWAWG